MPYHLKEQEQSLIEHLKKYGYNYPLTDYEE